MRVDIMRPFEHQAALPHSTIKPFIGRLRRFEDGILNHCDYAIGTSRLEGVNQKIKVIKRKAYGFHDPAYTSHGHVLRFL